MPRGTCYCLSLLTLLDKTNAGKAFNQLYPTYTKVLLTTRLIKNSEFLILCKHVLANANLVDKPREDKLTLSTKDSDLG